MGSIYISFETKQSVAGAIEQTLITCTNDYLCVNSENSVDYFHTRRFSKFAVYLLCSNYLWLLFP